MELVEDVGVALDFLINDEFVGADRHLADAILGDVGQMTFDPQPFGDGLSVENLQISVAQIAVVGRVGQRPTQKIERQRNVVAFCGAIPGIGNSSVKTTPLESLE